MRCAALLLTSVMVAVTVAAQQPLATPAPALSVSQIIAEMHSADLVLIQAGREAAARGLTAPFRRYGGRIVRDYTRADRQLQDEAASLGMRPASLPPPAAALNRLAAVGGPTLDHTLLDSVAQLERKTLATLQLAQQQVPHSPLTGLLHDLIPVMQVHLDLAAALLRPGAPI